MKTLNTEKSREFFNVHLLLLVCFQATAIIIVAISLKCHFIAFLDLTAINHDTAVNKLLEKASLSTSYHKHLKIWF